MTRAFYLFICLPLLALMAFVYHLYYTHQPYPGAGNYYPMLGEAFLAGRTNLDISTDPRLLALPDPFDYAARKESGANYKWDASIYDGKYYLYFGPTAAMVWAGVKASTGYALTDGYLTYLFSICGTIFLIALLLSIANHCNLLYSNTGLTLCILSLAFGTWIPFVLRRPAFYEAAIMGSYCFNALAMLLLWLGMKRIGSKALLFFALASLSFGLAVGSRINHGLNLGILGLTWLYVFYKKPQLSRFASLLCLLGPWWLCLGGLLTYNFMRFGDMFETGWQYQLTQFNQHAEGFRKLRLEEFVPHAYLYLLRPLEFKTGLAFPFYTVDLNGVDMTIAGGFRATAQEPIYGLFTNSPFALFVLALPLLWKRHYRTSPELTFVSVSLTLFGGAMLGFLCVMFYIVQRYSIDAMPWIMFLASLSYLQLLGTSSVLMRAALIAAGSVMAFYGVFAGLLSGCYGMALCQ